MANRFWVGGTGTWDSSTTTHWSTTTGGAGGSSAPGSSDVAIFDGASGGGTVTVNWASGTVIVQSITSGAFTGTLDFSANNNNVTLSANAGMNGSGSGTRTLNLGNGLWKLTASGASQTPWEFTTTTNLTFNANSSTIEYSGGSGVVLGFHGGGLTYNNVTFDAGALGTEININGINTFSTLTIGAGTYLQISARQNATNLTITGTSSTPASILVSAPPTTQILNVTGTVSITWTAFLAIVCQGGASFIATNSFDLGRNTGITITPPGGAARSRVFTGM